MGTKATKIKTKVVHDLKDLELEVQAQKEHEEQQQVVEPVKEEKVVKAKKAKKPEIIDVPPEEPKAEPFIRIIRAASKSDEDEILIVLYDENRKEMPFQLKKSEWFEAMNYIAQKRIKPQPKPMSEADKKYWAEVHALIAKINK